MPLFRIPHHSICEGTLRTLSLGSVGFGLSTNLTLISNEQCIVFKFSSDSRLIGDGVRAVRTLNVRPNVCFSGFTVLCVGSHRGAEPVLSASPQNSHRSRLLFLHSPEPFASPGTRARAAESELDPLFQKLRCLARFPSPRPKPQRRVRVRPVTFLFPVRVILFPLMFF